MRTQQVNHTEIAKALKDYRKNHGLTVVELSQSLNVTAVGNYERQEHAPSNWALKRMVKAAESRGLKALEHIFRQELLLRQIGTREAVEDPVEVLRLLTSLTPKELALEVLRLRSELAKQQLTLAAHIQP